MRTFHSGGVAVGVNKQPFIESRAKGVLHYVDLRVVEDTDGNFVVLNKNGNISIRDKNGLELESHKIVIGSIISVKDGSEVGKGDQIATWDPHSVPIITEKLECEFRDMIPKITVQTETDKETEEGDTVTEHKEDLHPQVVIVAPDSGEVLASYSIPVGTPLSEGEEEDHRRNAAGPDSAEGSQDPGYHGWSAQRAEFFEARRPKDACVIAKIDGVISFGPNVRGKKKVIVTDEETENQWTFGAYGPPHDSCGGRLHSRGEQITEGPVAPEDLLEACEGRNCKLTSSTKCSRSTVLRALRLTMHIEIIIRQMLRKVKITEQGDTSFLWGEQIERSTFKRENEEIIEQGGKPAEAEPTDWNHQGISRDRVLHLRCFLPGYHPGPHRGCNPW